VIDDRLPWVGPETIENDRSSPSGSLPVRVTSIGAAPAVKTVWGSAVGARLPKALSSASVPP
jgi:hypothetical protein